MVYPDLKNKLKYIKNAKEKKKAEYEYFKKSSKIMFLPL